MIQRGLLLILVMASAVVGQGCAAVGLTFLGVGAGVAAGTGTAYTLDGIAYRTFTAPVDDMRRATLASLKRMDIVVDKDEPMKDGRHVTAKATDRTIDIELERLTARTTRMRVTAKHGVFFRDRATAGEIITQTESALDDQTSLSQRAR